MANVYIQITPGGGCVVREAGKEDQVYTNLSSARIQSDDVTTAHALLRKSGRLLEDGQLHVDSSYQLTPDKRALTGHFEQRGCRYQVSLFVDKLSNGQERIGAVQVFPAQGQDVATYIDLYVSGKEPLAQSGFDASSRLFLK